MPPVIAIVSPGNMGAAVGRRLVEHGVTELTNLTDRSKSSQMRANEAGMTAVPMHRLTDADFLLSILPPAIALEYARQMVPLLAAARRQPLFVDCNAVSPQTVHRIAADITVTGADFVDAGIIGTPPQPGKDGPRFYACGEHAGRFYALAQYGLDIRLLDAASGAASALKLSFAGINKGIIAVAAAMILAANRAGAQPSLHRELRQHWSALLTSLGHQVPDMLPKAY